MSRPERINELEVETREIYKLQSENERLRRLLSLSQAPSL